MENWYAWLSKSTALSLSPSLVSEYALLLSCNELEEADIPHFDHEFLQSMGISVAKHRLEILKLARATTTNNRRPAPIARQLLAAFRKTKRCLTAYIHSLARHNRTSGSAIVVVPKAAPRGGGGVWWHGVVARRSKRVVLLNHAGKLVITNGAAMRPSPLSHSASPMVDHYDCGGDDEGFWKGGRGTEEIRWDSLFQDMKPT